MNLLKRWKNAVKNTVRWLMAWASQASGILAGFLLATTPFGSLVAGLEKILASIINFIFNLFLDKDVDVTADLPFWLWLGLGLVILCDWAADFTPNRKAAYGSMLWPSLPLHMAGTWGNGINSWAHRLNHWTTSNFGEKLGVTAAIGVAGALAIITVILAQKVLASGRVETDDASKAGTSTAASTTSSARRTRVGSRRR